MEAELEELKATLRSLVVSSPTQVDLRGLLRDYRNLMGDNIPLKKFGYRDPLQFLKEQCTDCFKFCENSANPVLTLMVPKSLQHIDTFVQRQKAPSGNRREFKGKRKSIPLSNVDHAKSASAVCKTDLVFQTFSKKPIPPASQHLKQSEVKAPDPVHLDKENIQNGLTTQLPHRDAVKEFLKKRLPLYDSLQCLEEKSQVDNNIITCNEDNDSGRQTSSTSSGTKRLQLEEFKSEMTTIIAEAPDGVWCTHLFRLYRARYGRELNYSRFGFTSLISAVFALGGAVHVTRPDATGDWRLLHASRGGRAR